MGYVDPRKILTGSDGYVLAGIEGGEMTRLIDATSFNAGLNVTNSDSQFLGDDFIYAVPTGKSVTISITEGVVRDDITVAKILDAYRAGKKIFFGFQGVFDRTMIDGQESRMTFPNCVPDGTITLMNMTPGEPLSRELAFRGNALPEYIKHFTG